MTNCHLDVKCRGFWSRSQEEFFDVRFFFNPLALSHYSGHLQITGAGEEVGIWPKNKINWVWIIHTPCYVHYRWDGLICKHYLQPTSKDDFGEAKWAILQCLIKCRIRFSLLRSAITAIHGSRSSNHATRSAFDLDCVPMTIAEGHVPSAAH